MHIKQIKDILQTNWLQENLPEGEEGAYVDRPRGVAARLHLHLRNITLQLHGSVTNLKRWNFHLHRWLNKLSVTCMLHLACLVMHDVMKE